MQLTVIVPKNTYMHKLDRRLVRVETLDRRFKLKGQPGQLLVGVQTLDRRFKLKG
ncbi:hypothetical protein BLA29_014401 [Euroglyphus maynei]|uniref:Uncharacterized protein n=1 Tax=Euroglyphus maynei TaxID=6958 RepID=A0A1Y3BPS9_EURMA|nr:hypothetical protein BLA29_014401 [Euroglyphus maynei]